MLRKLLTSFLKDGFIKKSLKVLVLRVGGVLLFFSVSLFLTNFFPTDVVGQYDFSRSILLTVGGLCLLGTDQAIIYFSGVLKSSNDLGELKDIYRKMILMVMGMSTTLFGLILIVPDSWMNLFFEKPQASELILKTFGALIFFGTTLLNIDTLRALQKPLFSELYRNIFRHLSFLSLVLLLFFFDMKAYVVEAFLFSFFLLALTSSIRVYVALSSFKEYTPSRKYGYNSILQRSYPMALSSIAYFLMQSVDIILLGKFAAFEIVAYYGVAVKVATITALALLSVNVIVAPKIAEFYANRDTKSLNDVVKKSARLVSLLSVPLILILFLFSEFALGLFGENFVNAKYALWVLLLGQFVKSLSGPVAIYMNMTGKQHVFQRILFIGLVINIALNWILIPSYGMVGAAIATAVSVVFWNIFAVIYVYRTDRIKTFIS